MCSTEADLEVGWTSENDDKSGSALLAKFVCRCKVFDFSFYSNRMRTDKLEHKQRRAKSLCIVDAGPVGEKEAGMFLSK